MMLVARQHRLELGRLLLQSPQLHGQRERVAVGRTPLGHTLPMDPLGVAHLGTGIFVGQILNLVRIHEFKV